MNTITQQQRNIVTYLSIAAGVLALVSMLLGLSAVNFNMDTFSNPVEILGDPSININQLRWFLITDLLGYYLLILPLLYFIKKRFENSSQWISFFASFGYGYVMVGALGATILTVTWPAIAHQYLYVNTASKEILNFNFLLLNDVVVGGLWNILEVLLGGVYWIAIGFYIKPRFIKILSYLLGVGCLLDALGEITVIPSMAEIGLNIYLLLFIIWCFTMAYSIKSNKL